jgi:hypothetical protein
MASTYNTDITHTPEMHIPEFQDHLTASGAFRPCQEGGFGTNTWELDGYT